MIDLLSMKKSTTIECKFTELPSEFEKVIRLHLSKDEESLICMVSRTIGDGSGKDFYIQLLTIYKLIRVIAKETKKSVIFSNDSSSDNLSILLSEFAGLKYFGFHYQDNLFPYTLNVITHSGKELEFIFYTWDSIQKFTQILLESHKTLIGK